MKITKDNLPLGVEGNRDESYIVYFFTNFGHITKEPVTKKEIIQEKIINSNDETTKYHFLRLKCPYCSYTKEYRFNYQKFDKEIHKKDRATPCRSTYYLGDMLNKIMFEKVVRGFVFHMESRVRISGCKGHIKLMESIYGKKYTLKKVREWYVKGIIALNNMKRYLGKQ